MTFQRQQWQRQQSYLQFTQSEQNIHALGVQIREGARKDLDRLFKSSSCKAYDLEPLLPLDVFYPIEALAYVSCGCMVQGLSMMAIEYILPSTTRTSNYSPADIGLIITTFFSTLYFICRKSLIDINEDKYIQRKLKFWTTFNSKAGQYGLFGKSGVTGALDKLVSLFCAIMGLLRYDTSKAIKHQLTVTLFFTNSGLFYLFGKYCERRYTCSRSEVKRKLDSYKQ